MAFFYCHELYIEFSGQKILYFYLNTQNYKQLYSTLLYLLLNNQIEDKDTAEEMLELFFCESDHVSHLTEKEYYDLFQIQQIFEMRLRPSNSTNNEVYTKFIEAELKPFILQIFFKKL